MIPKIIHTCWFSKQDNPVLSEKLEKCRKSWKEYCPDYEIKVWGIKDCPKDFLDIPHAKQCFEAGIASYAYLSNLFRLWVLFKHGGFYIETDVLLGNGLDDFLEDHVVLGEGNPGEIQGNIMASEAGHPLIEKLFKNLSERVWINQDHSLNIYHDTYLLGQEIRKEGYNFPDNIKEKTIIKGVSFCPKDFFVIYNKMGRYSRHLGNLSHYKKISIVMPIWNAEKYLSEAIDSVLSQDFEDFELLCINDGSTDSSKDIIQSYKDDRVVYIEKEHSGIVDSLNIGFRRAIGEYIARFDSDDIMLPGRLTHQYNYMAEHPEIDILSSGFQWGNGKAAPEFWRPAEKKLSLKSFIGGNCMSHPTTIFRAYKIKGLSYIYENYFTGVEDYKLWHHALAHGLVLATEPVPVNIYRQHDGQVTQQNNYHKETDLLLERTKRMYYGFKEEPVEKPRLTCIIPFQNEGSEVERTVANIRGTVGKNVDIILINDVSSDNFDYAKAAELFDCKYYENPKNYGVAGSRNFGVSVCETEYFLLLDAHMRFYEDNWHVNLIKNLDENPGCLVSSQTTVFTYNENTKLYSNEEGSRGRHHFGTYGAIVNLDEPGWEFTAKWTGKHKPQDNDKLLEIPCCLGAAYSTSKELWYKLGGLNGLIKYGLDEPLISLKVWLSGGKVLLMNDWGVGHLYRGKSPYNVPLSFLDQNQIYLIHLFTDSNEEIEKYENNLKKRLGDNRYYTAKDTFLKNYDLFKEFKEYFMQNVAVRDLRWFINYINNPSK